MWEKGGPGKGKGTSKGPAAGKSLPCLEHNRKAVDVPLEGTRARWEDPRARLGLGTRVRRMRHSPQGHQKAQ